MCASPAITSGRLLGAQLVGDHRAEVAKCIDIPAGALFHHMTVEGLATWTSATPTLQQPLGRHPARRPRLDPPSQPVQGRICPGVEASAE
jgi:hypothetical protein